MIAFEITTDDVQTAVKQGFDVELTDDQAEQILSLLNKQLVSDMAAFHADDDDDDDALNKATERAHINIIWQIQREPKKFSAIFAW